MSDGNYGGNGSVWWEVVHTAGPKGPPARLKKRHQSGTNEKNDHWLDDQGLKTVGHDPTNAVIIGHAGDGRFTVKLHFSTWPTFDSTAAGGSSDPVSTEVANQIATRKNLILQQMQSVIQQAQTAIAQLNAGAATVDLQIDVPAIARALPPAGPPNDPWEVNVHW